MAFSPFSGCDQSAEGLTSYFMTIARCLRPTSDESSLMRPTISRPSLCRRRSRSAFGSRSSSISVLIRSSLQPLLTPPAMRGRVGAVERVFIGGSNELGAFESGVAAAAIGAVPAVIVGGILSIAIAIVWAWRFPSLRRLDRFEDVRFVELPERDA